MANSLNRFLTNNYLYCLVVLSLVVGTLVISNFELEQHCLWLISNFFPNLNAETLARLFRECNLTGTYRIYSTKVASLVIVPAAMGLHSFAYTNGYRVLGQAKFDDNIRVYLDRVYRLEKQHHSTEEISDTDDHKN
jgi:hypothetical protein